MRRTALRAWRWPWWVAGLLLVSHPTRGQQEDEFDAWLQQEQAALTEFADARDQAFTTFLAQQWRDLAALQGLPQDPVAKPSRPPVAPAATPSPVPPRTPSAPALGVGSVLPPAPPVAGPPTAPEPAAGPCAGAGSPSEPTPDTPLPTGPAAPADLPRLPDPSAPSVAPAGPAPPAVTAGPVPRRRPQTGVVAPPSSAACAPLSVPFYGLVLQLDCDPAMRAMPPSLRRPADVAAAWAYLSRCEYASLLDGLTARRDSLQLSDWSYFQFVIAAATALSPAQADAANMVAWFALCKTGYRTRVGLDAAGLHVLLGTQTAVYDAPYFEFGGARYYALRPDGTADPVRSLRACPQAYPQADRAFDLSDAEPPRVPLRAETRTLTFAASAGTQQLVVTVDLAACEFYGRYPHVDYPVYFARGPSRALEGSLLPQLRLLLEGRTEVQSLNLLLALVQQAFPYRTDAEQFGRDRPLFAEETVHYPYSDCEDRAALFAWLVRRLLSLDVVGLDYPGHVATAVRCRTSVPGDGVMYQGQRFVVCDPTYLGAGVGLAMPDMVSRSPQVIPVGF